jgi:CRP/FNR family cyclic AMP-dependent transcriptional regulator
MGGGVFRRDEQGKVFSVMLVAGFALHQSALQSWPRRESVAVKYFDCMAERQKGVLKMPLIPNPAVLQRITALPLATYQPGETVIAAGTKTGRLLILRRGVVTIEKEGTVIAKVTEPGAVFGELSALLNQPHTADVRTLETSEFRVARAELLEEDPAALLYVAAILAQRLNLANQAVVELKSQIQLHHMIRSAIGKGVKKMEELLSATGADLVYAPGI